MYTLEQLAWFNRCLFPDNFAEDMYTVGGLKESFADMLKLDLRRRVKTTKLDILWIYQEYAIQDDAYKTAIEKVLNHFFNK